ncbi:MULTISPECIES: DNA polymerase I [Brucella/Ochrobactrum group]|uniref:DNA polymerase I n=1 Tax=Brucella anthropi (strain ATCC 49188 / DSM 6882 / CCUG 24695 / JCM 21032 / LMG 3331 / NBRC 15819 / NCTC 12168 / Alc 37) TaxID=439375 RepID=A6WV64_BRUA4|nr:MULTISPECIES: DNA polymerase I [Brucella/Ochrobactrum group]ABS12868.1 DNA polymerase I [Brucella anthropi ATCC 49188]AIK45150.1 DNA polymerase I [Brucella anthropi]KAB2734910.1 DNA polymerase I [Brucella anthropi]KAB2752986.1 DNA polymerase I [Brucella anthropi]KAB2763685.1 DNA polymerase I [Brucella anthropi]
MKKGDHLFLVDGSGYIFRAYHALPPLTRKTDGLPVGAVSGFCNMLWKLLKDARNTDVGVVPTHFAVIFDYSSKTFRNEIYPEYKANRTAPPEDLIPQFGLIRQATRAFNLPCIEKEGFEADDLIATYARIAEQAGGDVTIVSSDKDLMQLVTPSVSMYDSMKDKQISIPEVIEKWGVPPEKMIDLQSLTGDSTDNVPGIPGIGPKTAAQLLEEFGDLDTLLARASEIKQNKRRENILAFADQTKISRELVTLKTDVPLDVDLDSLVLEPQNGPKLIGFLKAMEFTSLTRRVAEATDTDASAVEPCHVETDWGADAHGPDVDVPAKADNAASQPTSAVAASDQGYTPKALAEKRATEAAAQTIDTSAYTCIRDIATLKLWLAEAVETGVLAFDTETTSLDPMQAELVGFSLALAPGRAAYIPLQHKSGAGDLLGGGMVEGQIPLDEALAALKIVLEDASVLKIAQNMKYDWLVMRRHGINTVSFDDTMLISYVLDAGTGSHGMDPLSERWLGHTPIPYKDVAGSGKSAVSFDMVDLDRATAYAAEDADVTLRLWQVLKPRLAAEGLMSVYERLERPLVDVLACMEERGIAVDRQVLSRLSGDLAQAAAAYEDEIYELAGERFNIGSPKQLGDILFGKMSLSGASKTKTGQWSTSAQVLEDLAAEGHPLPRKIVDWRQLTKLKSTYTDALPGFINPETKRVHTSYAMASTSTGRLSSSDPNLQNIPVRTAEGRKIRTAFIAEPGNKLVSADYSQIELRVLAHVADIAQLKQAFADGIDIHAMTASEMFGVPVEGMPSEVRRRAKAINFGIIYGISAFGLANQLSIPREEAGQYIRTYFERFPGIKDYMEATKAFARENGYVETIFGRRAHYPDIRASNPQVRAFNERAAINAPIQGSAADIIRRAMIRMEDALAEQNLAARMLLQVHDELIFEVPDNEVEKTIPVVRHIMENAAMPAVSLAVPLHVDARAAHNWDEAH